MATDQVYWQPKNGYRLSLSTAYQLTQHEVFSVIPQSKAVILRWQPLLPVQGSVDSTVPAKAQVAQMLTKWYYLHDDTITVYILHTWSFLGLK